MDILNFGLRHEEIRQFWREVVVRPMRGRVEEVALIWAEAYDRRHPAGDLKVV